MLQVVTPSFNFLSLVKETGELNLMFLVDGSGLEPCLWFYKTDMFMVSWFFALQTDLSQAGVRRWGRRCEGPAVQAIFP